MAQVLLFIHDFKLGTRISDSLTRKEKSVEFAQTTSRWPAQLTADTQLVIIDLDDKEFGTVELVSLVRAGRRDLKIVGYFEYVMKENHDKMKAAGCDLIISKSSLSRNIPSLLTNL